MGSEVELVKKDFCEKHSIEIVDLYKHQIAELAEVYNPQISDDEKLSLIRKLEEQCSPIYMHYPWLGVAFKMLEEKYFYKLKTNRNQYLITEEEQENLYSACISIAGMSVGSSILYGLIGTGIAKRINIADDDSVSTSNLNRIQARLIDVGLNKTVVAERKSLEMNPFLSIGFRRKLISDDDISEFLFWGKASVVFDEIDDFGMKYKLRKAAKQYGIPLIMLTNLADSVLIDVERYDSQPDTELFNGNVSRDILHKLESSDVGPGDIKMLSRALVDKTLITQRANASLNDLGTKLAGRPQLYSTVALDGGVAPFLVRKIILKEKLESGRYSLSLNNVV